MEKGYERAEAENEFCRIVLKPVEMASERLRMLYMKVEQLGKEEIREENSVQFAAIKQEIRQLQEICCPKFTIRFCSCAYYWEYLCVFKDENDMRGKDLRLRTRENVVAFGAPESMRKQAWEPMSGDLFLQDGSKRRSGTTCRCNFILAGCWKAGSFHRRKLGNSSRILRIP